MYCHIFVVIKSWGNRKVTIICVILSFLYTSIFGQVKSHISKQAGQIRLSALGFCGTWVIPYKKYRWCPEQSPVIRYLQWKKTLKISYLEVFQQAWRNLPTTLLKVCSVLFLLSGVIPREERLLLKWINHSLYKPKVMGLIPCPTSPFDVTLNLGPVSL